MIEGDRGAIPAAASIGRILGIFRQHFFLSWANIIGPIGGYFLIIPQ